MFSEQSSIDCSDEPTKQESKNPPTRPKKGGGKPIKVAPMQANQTIASSVVTTNTRRSTAIRSTTMLIFAGDMASTILACAIAYAVRFGPMEGSSFFGALSHFPSYQSLLLLGVCSMAASLYWKDTYSIDSLSRYRYGALRAASCSLYFVAILLGISLFFEMSPAISRVWAMLAGLFTALTLGLWRLQISRFLIRHKLLNPIRRKALVVGWNEQAESLYQRSEQSNAGSSFFPFRVLSCVLLEDEENSAKPRYPARIYRGGDLGALEKQIQSGRHSVLILATTDLPRKMVGNIQELCAREMVDFISIPDYVQILQSCLHIESVAGMPILTQGRRQIQQLGNRLLKRSFDMVGATFGLLFFAPVIALFCWRVYRESPGPVFYRQVRTGVNGKPFEIIKIRSMRLDAEQATGAKWCTEDDPRRLSIGAFMRKYNIDELPQFWNVIKGEMSLVGPRPERPELISGFKYDVRYYNIRHMVKPGITGWAQVNGWRGDTCLHSRIASDIEYIEQWNFWFDIYICFKTVFATKNAY